MDSYFGKNGRLSEVLDNFQPRAGQLEMAEAVHGLLHNGDDPFPAQEYADVLLIEAETGIGKSLAYLLPATLSGKRLVVSTATINLQDQILNKEVPLLRRILNQEISAICVKGRQNYLCFFRWYQYRSSPQLSLLDDDFCDRIDDWLLETETGDRAELDWLPDNSPLWPKISAQSHQCLGGDCPEGAQCFINELRRRAGGASLLIVNHHLFFSDLALKKAGYGEILPRYEGVIFDEAHHLESVASNFFGKSFSQYQVIDLVGDVERQAELDLPPSQAGKMISAVRGLKERIESFAGIFPTQRGRFSLLDLIDKEEDWYDEVKHLATALERTIAELNEFKEYGEGWRTLVKRADELHANLVEIALPDVVLEKGRQVHWYEKRDRSFALSITPVSVAQSLQSTLYPAVKYCIMTSATLSTGGDFSYICYRLGLDVEVPTLCLKSPFNYEKRARIYVPEKGFPLPTENRYSEALNQRVNEILTISSGRGLVLCTSFRGMENLAEYLNQHLPYPVLVQGQASRHSLLQQFQEITNSVLVAVASFWEGVDVPGEALSCVIIDKLPFEVPSDPVLQARIEDIKDSGGKPFFDFQVPRAILTLRQGVGRLMRTSEDWGIMAVMDVRLYAKGYGRTFLKSLPEAPVIRDLEEVTDFFADFDQQQ